MDHILLYAGLSVAMIELAVVTMDNMYYHLDLMVAREVIVEVDWLFQHHRMLWAEDLQKDRVKR